MLRAVVDLFSHAFDAHISIANVRVTTPVGPAQPDFLNAAVMVRTDASPEALLAMALRIEQRLGRERTVRWGPRTIDVDVLWVDQERYESEALSLPHARLKDRVFALAPLLDLCPNAREPSKSPGEAEGTSYAVVLDALAKADPTALAKDCFALPERFETITLTHHTADEGFRVFAMDRADTLAAAAEAVANTMIHPENVRALRVVEVKAKATDALGYTDDCERLWSWLSEVLFTLDSQRIAARKICVLADEPTFVRGLIIGEPIDESRHTVGTAIKAITYHDLQIGPVNEHARPTHARDGWYAEVIVDV